MNNYFGIYCGLATALIVSACETTPIEPAEPDTLEPFEVQIFEQDITEMTAPESWRTIGPITETSRNASAQITLNQMGTPVAIFCAIEARNNSDGNSLARAIITVNGRAQAYSQWDRDYGQPILRGRTSLRGTGGPGNFDIACVNQNQYATSSKSELLIHIGGGFLTDREDAAVSVDCSKVTVTTKKLNLTTWRATAKDQNNKVCGVADSANVNQASILARQECGC